MKCKQSREQAYFYRGMLWYNAISLFKSKFSNIDLIMYTQSEKVTYWYIRYVQKNWAIPAAYLYHLLLWKWPPLHQFLRSNILKTGTEMPYLYQNFSTKSDCQIFQYKINMGRFPSVERSNRTEILCLLSLQTCSVCLGTCVAKILTNQNPSYFFLKKKSSDHNAWFQISPTIIFSIENAEK